MKSKKTIQKKSAKKKSDAPDAPEVLITDVNGGETLRVFDQGALFGIEKSTGTVDLVAKDRVAYFFRRSGNNIAYSPQGYDAVPPDSAAYVTIEEVEEQCSEVTDGDRERSQDALTEDEHRAKPTEASNTRIGVLSPPAPRE